VLCASVCRIYRTHDTPVFKPGPTTLPVFKPGPTTPPVVTPSSKTPPVFKPDLRLCCYCQPLSAKSSSIDDGQFEKSSQKSEPIAETRSINLMEEVLTSLKIQCMPVSHEKHEIWTSEGVPVQNRMHYSHITPPYDSTLPNHRPHSVTILMNDSVFGWHSKHSTHKQCVCGVPGDLLSSVHWPWLRSGKLADTCF